MRSPISSNVLCEEKSDDDRLLYELPAAPAPRGAVMASTRIELVALLQEKQKALPKRSGNLAYVIARARNGKYHDWESDADTPKVNLLRDLATCQRVDLSDIIARVKAGEFDEEPTDEQLDELREEIGPEEFDKMFGERGQA